MRGPSSLWHPPTHPPLPSARAHHNGTILSRYPLRLISRQLRLLPSLRALVCTRRAPVGFVFCPVNLWDEESFVRDFACTNTGMIHVFLMFVATNALNYAKAPGPSEDRGGWPWRAIPWCVPPCPGCTYCKQLYRKMAPAGDIIPAPPRATREDMSFKPERAFDVIAHVRDWEHAETVRRRCPSGQLEALPASGVHGPRVTCG